jgi:purine-binding chemotaxis protein CheW
MKGFVTFRLGDREFATALDEVREVVRLQGLAVLPGMEPPMAGVIELRGVPLPVMDLRSSDGLGDVLVLADDAGSTIGVAVDNVVAVRPVDQLVATTDPTVGLPAYVVEVLRDVATGSPIMRVDLRRMLALAAV